MSSNILKKILVHILIVVIAVGGVLIAPTLADAQSSYSSGTYGTCTYNACGITFGADASANIDVTPVPGSTACSVARTEVQVSTDSSTGYTLSMTDTDTDTSLNNGSGGTIATTSGSSGTPVALAANKWGYRVDGINGFGAGPTNAVSSGSVPAVNFAAIPSSAATPDVVATQTTPASPYQSTFVWYGVCVDTTVSSGAYSDSVTYTVVVN